MRLLLAAGLTALALLSPAAPASAAADLNCRASAARVTVPELGNLVAEPVRANAPGSPCSDQSASTVERTTLGPVTADAVNAVTERDAGGVTGAAAFASITRPRIELPGLVIEATALQAQVSASCTETIGDSRVVELVVNGEAISVPAGGEPFELDLGPLGVISLNEELREGDTVTRRALRVTTPLVEIVLAEAIAGRTGPCTGDEVDPDPDPDPDPDFPNPCPPGSTYDAERNLCVIREEGGNTIVVGPPYSGPSGGTVISGGQAREQFPKSKCLPKGNDKFVIVGTPGRDYITGTNKGDWIILRKGSDRSEGGRGGDCIDGGKDRDAISGALGKDKLWGRSGKDNLNGGSRTDKLRAGKGADSVNTGFGEDRVWGGGGRDVINAATAGPPSRKIRCGRGSDVLRINHNERRRHRGCERVHSIR